MGANSETFLELRAQDFVTMYDASFTKKEAQKVGIKLVTDLLDNGNVDKMEFIANLARLSEVVGTAMTEARKHITEEKQTVMGVEFTPVNGGNTINYSEDPIYQQLKADLDARAELLKLAQKQDLIDAYGNDVPRVSTTPRKSSITIKF
jgi:flagellar biosynthesis regulator FlaF